MRDPVEGQRVARLVAQRACRLRKSRSTGVSTRAPLIVRSLGTVRLYTSQTHAPVRVQRHADQDYCIYDPATHYFRVFGVGATGFGRRATPPRKAVHPRWREKRSPDRDPGGGALQRRSRASRGSGPRRYPDPPYGLRYVLTIYTPQLPLWSIQSTQQAPGRAGAHMRACTCKHVVCSLRSSSSKYRACVFREAGRQPSARPR